MSENGFEDPHHDEPTPEVYRRRRLIALIAALLIILLLLWGIVAVFRAIGNSESDSAAAVATASASTEPFSDFSERASESATASESAEGSESAEARASETADPAESDSAEETEPATAEKTTAEETVDAAENTGEAITACNASDMQVSLTTDQNSYASGQNPALAITYTNTSGAPCSIGGEGQVVDLNITSGSAQVYNYAQCQDAELEETELAAGANGTKVISWDRSLNALGCENTQIIKPGYYWATATVNGVSSQPTRIIVTG